MSIYIGRNDSNLPTLHITKSQANESQLHNSSPVVGLTSFMTNQYAYQVVNTETYSGSQYMSSYFVNVINGSDGTIPLIYALYDGQYYELPFYPPSAYPILNPYYSSSRNAWVTTTNTMNFTIFIIYIKPIMLSTLTNNGIYIGNNDINIGGLNLSSIPFFQLSTTQVPIVSNYYIANKNKYINIMNTAGVGASLKFSDSGILISKSGSDYPFIGSNSFSTFSATKTASYSSGATNHPIVDLSQFAGADTIFIKSNQISFSYYASGFKLQFAFSFSLSSSFTRLLNTPYFMSGELWYISYDSSSHILQIYRPSGNSSITSGIQFDFISF